MTHAEHLAEIAALCPEREPVHVLHVAGGVIPWNPPRREWGHAIFWCVPRCKHGALIEELRAQGHFDLAAPLARP